MPDISEDLHEKIDRIRHFNRMYISKMGVLTEKIFESPFSLTEARVLYEVGLHKSTTATILCRDLGLDGGYLSRILNGFEKQELITKERSEQDARQREIVITRKGKKACEEIASVARQKVIEMITPLNAPELEKLMQAFSVIEEILIAPALQETVRRRGGAEG